MYVPLLYHLTSYHKCGSVSGRLLFNTVLAHRSSSTWEEVVPSLGERSPPPQQMNYLVVALVGVSEWTVFRVDNDA